MARTTSTGPTRVTGGSGTTGGTAVPPTATPVTATATAAPVTATPALPTAGLLDMAPPQITAVTADNIRSDRARITWRANEDSTRQLEDGTATAYGQQTTLDPTLTLNHTVQLRNLSRGTTYHYRATSQDAAGNVAVSGDFTFTTTP